ncbi:MAG: CpsD/CapB family tyrosine-protein kinase [Clostridia bacterium]|nr:CpsD/CapB family tyrosine-protein kinase [Clostridia bacterium]
MSEAVLEKKTAEKSGYELIKPSPEAKLAFEQLKDNIIYSLPANEDQSGRIIGLTSAIHGEGKTATTVNLGATLAEAGKKVVIIETDMRNPDVSKKLDVSSAPGLSDYLVHNDKNLAIIKHSGIHENLFVIPAGNVSQNPTKLLCSAKMDMLIKMLSKQFEYVVVDLPSICADSTAAAVAQIVEGMLFVVREGYSSKREVANAIDELKRAEVKILGFVMNGLNLIK